MSEESTGTDLVTQAASGGLLAMIDGVANNPFLAYTDEIGVQDGQYLRHSGNTGLWTATGNTPVEAGAVFAMNIMEAKHVWMGWNDGKPVKQIETPLKTRAPRMTEAQLPDLPPKVKNTDGWKECMRIPVRSVEGGPQLDLTEKAETPYRPILKLIKEYGQCLAMNRYKGPDGEMRFKTPLVEIGSRSFELKTEAGKKFAPTFKIIGWKTDEELLEMAGGNLEGEPAPEEANAFTAGATPAATQPTPAAIPQPAAIPATGRPVGRRM